MHRTSSLIKQMCFLAICLLSTSLRAVTPADFAKDYQYHEAKMSPDGKHIGLILVHEGKRRLAVVDAKTFAPVGGADFGDKQEVGQFFWANNERLVIKIYEHEPWQKEPAFYGELYAVNYDGKRGKIIYGYSAGDKQTGTKLKKQESVDGWADIVSLLDDDEKHILISSTPWSRDGSRVPTVHKLNIYNGKMSGIVASGPVTFADFLADDNGKVRIAVGRNSDDETRVFVHSEEEEWTALDIDSFGESFYPMAMDKSNKHLYVADNLNQDKTGIFKINLETGKREHIYTDEKVDIAEVEFNSDMSGVYAVRLESDYPNYVVFNTETEEGALFKELLKTFQGYRISIRSSDDENNLWIIQASNDVSAGSFYLYNKKTNKFNLLFNNYTHVSPDKLSQSIPVSFKASDGVDLHGFITYPNGIPETQNVPLVTLVHGGPHGPRDYWTFDSRVQMLAAQGYAVLRVNFRGSGGYGTEYLESGYKQWGDRIQQDIIEGTKWVIAQGGIEQSKVCIMGGSFGGYSAVQSAILAPQLFKCVVATAGVYNLPALFEEGNIANRLLFGQSYLEKALGTDMKQLESYSPIFNLEKLKAPVLISHGTKDRQAPFEQAVELKDKLESLGKAHVWNPVNAETHGFYGEANRTAYFEKVAGFLAEHLK